MRVKQCPYSFLRRCESGERSDSDPVGYVQQSKRPGFWNCRQVLCRKVVDQSFGGRAYLFRHNEGMKVRRRPKRLELAIWSAAEGQSHKDARKGLVSTPTLLLLFLFYFLVFLSTLIVFLSGCYCANKCSKQRWSFWHHTVFNFHILILTLNVVEGTNCKSANLTLMGSPLMHCPNCTSCNKRTIQPDEDKVIKNNMLYHYHLL